MRPLDLLNLAVCALVSVYAVVSTGPLLWPLLQFWAEEDPTK